jgi:glycosyltransferase involved in cell wall biosynthesis
MGVITMKAGTIVARNYLAQASVLAKSFNTHNPEFPFHILVIDGDESDRNCFGPSTQIVLPSDLPVDSFVWHAMATIYEVMEFATAIKPKFLEFLLNDNTSSAVYLDPDIQVFSHLGSIEEELAATSVVLTPHCLFPIPRDGMETSEKTLRHAGIFNLGFVGVSQSGKEFLQWWHERLKTDAVVDLANALFTDQRWIDFVPSLFPCTILRDAGLNVAYWNLHERTLSTDNNTIRVNSDTLKFFHFSGLDPATPWQLTKHAGANPRVEVNADPILEVLVNDYSELLQSAGHAEQKKMPYGFDQSADGIPLNSYIRRAYLEWWKSYLDGEAPQPPDPFNADSSDFTSWLSIAKNGVPGYQFTDIEYQLWKSRPDLQHHFPDVLVEHSHHYVKWLKDDPLAQKLFAPLQNIRKNSIEINPVVPGGFNVIGYFSAELGVGEAGRRLADVVRCTGMPTQEVGVRTSHSRELHPNTREIAASTKYDHSILAVNADQTARVIMSCGLNQHPRRRRIGFWFWELSEFPEISRSAFAHVSEVWCASEFTRDAVAAVSPLPVQLIHLPISVPPAPTPYSKKQAGLPEGFVFLFTFDFNSVMKRKNPIDVLTSYTMAFGPNDGAHLIIKSINGLHQKTELAKLRFLAAHRPDVIIQDGYLTAGLVQAQIELSDCFVSLHRSEGYGLNIAAAMAAGKPAISTGYSGNMTFTSPDYPFLVPYELEPVGENAHPYDPKAMWAQPNITSAASIMRSVFDNYSQALQHAEQEKLLIMKNHSLEVAVQSIKPLIIN